jgi:hypothetical protein
MNQPDATYIRALTVSVRRGEEGGEEGGLLLETYFGRYILNRDAREVWRLIDGHRPVSAVAKLIGEARGVTPDEIYGPLDGLCRRLCELGLLETAA